MIKFHTGVKLTPRQLASHIVADYGPYVQGWIGYDCWQETIINMTDLEIEMTNTYVDIQSLRVLEFLNLKDLG